MNLLHVTPYYAPAWAFGGVVQAVAGLAETQAATGHQVTVLTTDALDRRRRIDARSEVLGDVSVVRIRNASAWLRGRFNLDAPLGLGAAAGRLIRERSIDLIHAHEQRTVENLLVAPAARRLGVPLLVSPHGTLPYSTGRGLAKRLWDAGLGRRWMRSISLVHALTEVEADEARRLWARLGIPLRPNQIAVVPNGVVAAPPGPASARRAFRDRWGLGDRQVVLYLGRLSERKGLELLLTAFGAAAQRIQEARLVIAGPDEGVLGRLRAQARAAGIEGRVLFTGLLTGEERLGAFRAADVFALAATGEGFAIAALEALASGLPVVLTEGCNFPEVAGAGAGFVVPPSAEALSAAIQHLLHDAPLRGLMAERGRDLIASRYAWPIVAGEMEGVYRTVLDRGGRPGR
jgi:glycosyltransferase involved in cell wall biosynthesis